MNLSKIKEVFEDNKKMKTIRMKAKMLIILKFLSLKVYRQKKLQHRR